MVSKTQMQRGRVLRIAVGITMLVLLLAGDVGAENSYDFVLSIPSQQWFFDTPNGVAVDSSGNVYVSDSASIQKFSSSGVLISKWGSAGYGDGQFSSPSGVAVDSSGNVYVADTGNYRIQKFSSSGVFISKWGSYGSGDGQFSYPIGVAVDSSGNVYVSDMNNNGIQKFSSSGVFISKWGSLGSGNGQFNSPIGVTVDTSGNVYVVDAGNYRIQKFSSSGVFKSKWGSYGTGNGQFLDPPQGIAVDGSGNVYVVDYHNYGIQKFSSSGVFISKWGSFGTGNGQFSSPYGVAVDSSGNVYVSDVAQNNIQKFSSSGVFISKWGSSGSGNGQFSYPQGIAVDSSGNVYVSDNGNRRIQKFSSSGVFISKWGSSGSGDGQFSSPSGVAVDSIGNVYVSDVSYHRIQKFSSSGVFISKWGSLGVGDGQFSSPYGVAVDSIGNVYISDNGNRRIQKFSSSGVFISKWGSSGSGDGQFSYPRGVAVDSSGNVYVSDSGNGRIQKFSSSGVFISKWGSSGSGDGQFISPQGIAVDSIGNVYVVDAGNYRIQKFSSSGVFISKWGSSGSGNGQFSSPSGVGVDGSGNAYVVDSYNYRIQKFKWSAFLNLINVTPNSTDLFVGDIQTFTASTKDQYNDDFTAIVTWASSNETVGTVNSNTGEFTASAEGTTMVNATNGSVTGTSVVTVERVLPHLTSINVTPNSTNLFVGDIQTFTASTKDQYNDDFTAIVTWASSNETVGTVNSNTGEFTALAAGTTMVNATNGSVTGTALVSVIPTYNISGYVFDNYLAGQEGVLVQNGSNTAITETSGYYSITGLLSGVYNFSYSKAGFSTGYLEITINDTDVLNANKTIYDNMPPASVKDLLNVSYAANYINWTWTEPSDTDFAKVMVYLNGVYKDDVLKGIQHYNATVSPGTYTIGTRTVDTNENINATMVTNTSTTILPTLRFINGTVKDNSTGDSLAGVKVSANSTLSTTSDATGFYSFAVTDDSYDLISTYDIRYYTNTTTVSTNGQAVVWQDIEMIKKPTGNITGSVTG